MPFHSSMNHLYQIKTDLFVLSIHSDIEYNNYSGAQ